MKTLKLLIRQKNDDKLRRNNFLRLDKNERNFKFNSKYLNKFKKVISSSLIQSYPENLSNLKKIIAKKEKINEKFISITPGADGALKYIFEIFKNNKRKNISSLFPTYAMLDVYTKIFQFKLKKVFRSVDETPFIKDLINNTTDLVYIANPNMPDGQIIEKREILYLLKQIKRKKIFLILDETYVDFSKHESLKHLVKKNNNLIIIKSFSKSLGLAGLRLGYILASPSVLNLIEKIKPLADISSLSAEIALVLLRDKQFQRNYLDEIKKSKELVRIKCRSINLNLIETETNFFHLVFRKKINEIYQKLKKNKILVRKNKVMLKNSFQNTLRITYSDRKNMNYFFKKLKLILSQI